MKNLSNYDYSDAQESLDYIKKFLPPNFTPKTAIVFGSGLGGTVSLIEDVEEIAVLDADDIPHWPSSTAPGHAGKILVVTIKSRPVIIVQGRVHCYEGYSMKTVTFPVRVLGMLGVKEYVATNASGAVNVAFRAGEIIAVSDHINLMGDNPLAGPNEPRWNERFPDMSSVYDVGILKILADIGLRKGVYAAMKGPSFETPAEIRMLRAIGADLVGMSTVPEIITANAMGMKVAALSCVANMAAGIELEHRLTSQEVLDAMRDSANKLSWVLMELIEALEKSQ